MCWLRAEAGSSSTWKVQYREEASQMEFITGPRKTSEPAVLVKVTSLALFAVLAGPVAFGAGLAPKEFIKDAIEGNLAEAQVGRLAQQKAASPEVKEFGARLERDHAAANAKAEQVAQYAEQVLPDLQKHLQIAEHLQETLKTAKASNSSK